MWDVLGIDQLPALSDAAVRDGFHGSGVCIARQEKSLGKQAKQGRANLIGRHRFDEKRTAKAPRFRFKNFVVDRARDDGDEIGTIGFRAKQQLEAVELPQADIGDQHRRMLGNPQPLCLLKRGRLERLAAQASNGDGERPHTLRIGVDDEHFHALFGPSPAAQFSMHRRHTSVG
jgi:hypothetical protein